MVNNFSSTTDNNLGGDDERGTHMDTITSIPLPFALSFFSTHITTNTTTTNRMTTTTRLRPRKSSWWLLWCSTLLHHGITTTTCFPVTARRTARSSSRIVPIESQEENVPRCIVPTSLHFMNTNNLKCSWRLHAYRRHRPSNADASSNRDSAGAGDSSASSPPKRSTDEDKQPGWRRRVFSRFRRKRTSHSQDALQMKSASHVDVDDVMSSGTHHSNPTGIMTQYLDQFVSENFEKLSPEQLFRTLEDSQYVLNRDRNRGCAALPSAFFETPLELPVVSTTTSMENVTTTTTPNAAFSVASLPLPLTRDQVDNDMLLECTVLKSQLMGETCSFEGGPPVRKLVRNWFQNVLTNCFSNWAVEPPLNLQVRVSPTGNVLWPLLGSGEIHCNARVDFDRIVFGFIRLSGGSIEASRMALNLLGFTVDHSHLLSVLESSSSSSSSSPHQTIKTTSTTTTFKTSTPPTNNATAQPPPSTGQPPLIPSLLWKDKAFAPRYLSQFDLHANDCVLTQQDLFESSCVRNGLQNLLVRILKRRGIRTKSVDITDITILKSGKISVKGKARVRGGTILSSASSLSPSLLSSPTISFEVRSGIGFSCRGHVLTFPGLELSLSPDVGLFVPIMPTVELDVGHNARLRELSIDGKQQLVKLTASVTITPNHTLKLSQEYKQSSRAYSARFSYDVGKWLTRIGRFSL